jgi:hypothetical protein
VLAPQALVTLDGGTGEELCSHRVGAGRRTPGTRSTTRRSAARSASTTRVCSCATRRLASVEMWDVEGDAVVATYPSSSGST